jgi:hypothetical protein
MMSGLGEHLLQLFPQRYGCQWGDSRADCNKALGTKVIPWAGPSIRVRTPEISETAECAWCFDDAGRLEVITAELHKTRDFSEDPGPEDLERAGDEMEQAYGEVLASLSCALGPAGFDEESEGASPITGGECWQFSAWDLPEGQVQLVLGQGDQWDPIYIDLFLICPTSEHRCVVE